MYVDITQIPAEGLDIHFSEDADFLDPSEGWVSPVGPIEATLRLSRTPAGVSVRGQVSSDLRLHCSRCDEVFTVPVREGFAVEYREPLKARVEEEHELAGNELDVSFLEEEGINIAGLVRENVLLALPVQPLCRDDCRGLCPRCGTNLNKRPCSCTTTHHDPRWRKLESLR